METFLAYTILGLSLGAAYAVAAAGLVVTYTTSGIFNFSHGAIAMAAAFVYWQLRWDEGWGGRWPAPVAVVVVVGILGPLFGVFVERIVMRNLRGTSETVKIVIPIAVLLALTGLVNWTWQEAEARRPIEFFGNTNTVSDSLPVAVLWHDVTVLGSALGLAVVLFLFLFRTRAGIVMRAVVDSTSLSQLNGVDPDRASAASWALGSGIAALAGVLLSPNLGSLSPLPLTLLVANVFAAAVFGRLRSLPLTFAGAMIVGLAVNYWTWFKADVGRDWSWLANLRPALPMLLLGIFLLVLPQERLRGATVERTRERFRVPTMGEAATWAVVLVVVIAAWASIMEPSPQILLSRALAFGIIALSIVLLTGYAGELNLAPLAFAGIGAIVVYQVDVGPNRRAFEESASVLGFVLAAVICAAVGALVALPALRLRGLYLALATFAFAVLVSNLVFKQIAPLQLNVPWIGDGEDVEINLFSGGSVTVPRPAWFGVDLGRGADLRQNAWLVFLAICFGVVGVSLVALRRSSFGLRLAAMKDSPAAAATLGQNLVRIKLTVFALSAAIAGVGGALFAAGQGSARENDFEIFVGLGLFMITVIAGVGYVTGALLGGALFAVGFVVIGDFWGKLAVDYPAFAFGFDFLQDFFVFVGPAMAGIGLGRNPSGFTTQMFEGYRPLKQRAARPFVVAGVAVLVLLWVAAATDVIGNWAYVLATVATLVAIPKVTYTVHPELDPTRPGPADGAPEDDVDLATVDLDDLDEDRIARIDAALELDRLQPTGRR